MKVWAIKHKPTDTWMPARMFKAHGVGWSYWIPGSNGKVLGLDGFDKNPRIFFTLQSARNALTAWLQGEWSRKQGVSVDWEGTPDPYDDMVVNAAPFERKREEMEIVLLELRGV